MNELETQTAIGKEVLATDNIWTAIEVLTNRLGMKVGQHLKTLLCKVKFNEELHARPTLVDSNGNIIPEKETDKEKAEWERMCARGQITEDQLVERLADTAMNEVLEPLRCTCCGEAQGYCQNGNDPIGS